MVSNPNKYISAAQRITSVVDRGKFDPFDFDLRSRDVFNFPDYNEKLASVKNGASTKEAVISGVGVVGGHEVVVIALDPTFMLGTVNHVVGETIKKAIDYAIDKKRPLITFTSSAGARLQEGVFSLLEFSSIMYHWEMLKQHGVLSINILTNPTMGGVSASFAFAGDYIFAEQNATIGFAGKRVVNMNNKTPLDEDFQTAEPLLKHGQVDDVISTDQIRTKLIKLLELHK